VGWIGIARSKFYDWRARYGKVNEHNAWIPRDHWIEDWERDAIVKFAQQFPLEDNISYFSHFGLVNCFFVV
jgi:hypothetical protein